MLKSLDQKLARLRADSAANEFILADAKDADMAFGLSAPGFSPEYHGDEARFKTLDEYRQQIRENVAQGQIDIMLMSVSTHDVLTIGERLFDTSHITPAVRANDTSDIWLASGSGRYPSQPAKPFRTARIDHAMCGHEDCDPSERHLGADLGLYSITLNNDVQLDHPTLQAFHEFRVEAERKQFRYFLEVFAPNACGDHCPADVARFINDSIVRTLAGVPTVARPVFLKIPYFGPAAMESLVAYDSSLVVGVLGGSSGTTLDAFHMLWEAKKYGARAALYGRKINNAEHQRTFIQYLRRLAQDEIRPAEAVRAYHADLARLGIRPIRELDADLQLTAVSHNYGDGAQTESQSVTSPSGAPTSTSSCDPPSADFNKMTPAEKTQWNLNRWKRILD